MKIDNSGKILIICGPTATGKTGLGISLAKKFNGEIISADSRQVYIGMDIATGKDLPKISNFHPPAGGPISNLGRKDNKYRIGYYLFDEVPVWMLDVVKPNQEFSVSGYVEISEKIISDIFKRGKLPILVGGTGLYIRGIIDGIGTMGILPDWELRKDLDKLSVNELFEMLVGLNRERANLMNYSDKNNPRRLIRAIEIAQVTKNLKLKTEYRKNFDSLFIGLTAPYEILYKRIDKRINAQIGLDAEGEIKRLLREGYDWNLPAMTAMGYGVWKSYFEKVKTKEEIIQQWKYDEHAYARRQMTWFRKNPRINWIDITKQNCLTKVEHIVEQWYNFK